MNLRRAVLGVGLVASGLLAGQVAKYKRGTQQRFDARTGATAERFSEALVERTA